MRWCALALHAATPARADVRTGALSLLAPQARAFLADVRRQTLAADTELLVGLVEGAYDNALVDEVGREMATKKLLDVRVVLWHEDLGAPAPRARLRVTPCMFLTRALPGLYGCWSFMNKWVAAAEYRVRCLLRLAPTVRVSDAFVHRSRAVRRTGTRTTAAVRRSARSAHATFLR